MQKLIAIVFLVGTTMFVMGDAREQGFVWDDKQTVLQNDLVSPATFSGTWEAWTSTKLGAYTPVPVTIWNGVTRVFADTLPAVPKAQTLHTISLVCHLISVALVFLIIGYFVPSAMAAFCGTLLFALHPLQVEPVTWISAAPIVMGAMFALVAIWQYLAHVRAMENSRSHRPRSKFRAYVATASFFAAMLSHPAMIVTPLIAYLAEALLPRTNTLMRTQRSGVVTIAWLVLGAPLVVMAIMAQDTSAMSGEASIWARPLVAGDALAFYLYKLFAPVGMAPDYGRSPHYLLGHWWGYVSWIAPLLLGLALMMWQHKVRGLFAGAAAMFGIGLLPFLGLVAFESQSMSTVADRYAYLALLGPALALAHLMSIPRKVVLPFLGLVAIVAFGLLSHAQIEHWQNDDSLWKQSLASGGASPRAHQVMGDRAWENKNWQEARKHYESVLAANNTNPDIHYYLAEIAAREGRNTSAIDLYTRVLELDPEYSKAFSSFAMVLLSEDQLADAQEYLKKALEIDTGDVRARYELGKTLLKLDREEEAMASFAKALDDPKQLGDERVAEAHSILGHSMNRNGDKQGARGHLEKSLAIAGDDLKSHRVLADIYFANEELDKARSHYLKAKPAYVDDPILYFHLGKTQMEAKNYKDAAANFEKAIELNEEDADAVLNLAIAFFQLRRFGDAITKFKEALQLNKNLPDAHYYLGDMERWAGKIERALGHYYLALKIDENHPQSHYRLGNYFMEKDNVRKAIWHYRNALKKAPEDSRIQGRLARAERKLKSM